MKHPRRTYPPRASRCFAACIAAMIGCGAVLPSEAAAETSASGCHGDALAETHAAPTETAPHHPLPGGRPTRDDDQSVPCPHCPADACAILAPCAGVSADAAMLNVTPLQDRTGARDGSFGAVAPGCSVINLPSTPPPRSNL